MVDDSPLCREAAEDMWWYSIDLGWLKGVLAGELPAMGVDIKGRVLMGWLGVSADKVLVLGFVV